MNYQMQIVHMCSCRLHNPWKRQWEYRSTNLRNPRRGSSDDTDAQSAKARLHNSGEVQSSLDNRNTMKSVCLDNRNTFLPPKCFCPSNKSSRDFSLHCSIETRQKIIWKLIRGTLGLMTEVTVEPSLTIPKLPH